MPQGKNRETTLSKKYVFSVHPFPRGKEEKIKVLDEKLVLTKPGGVGVVKK